MSKSKGTWGTPVNHVGPAGAFIGNREGWGAEGSPPGYPGGAGTVKNQFEGDQKGNRQVEAANGWPEGTLGTPFNSSRGNVDEFSRTRLADRYGVNESGGGPIDMNDPKANGNGVILDAMSREKGWQPHDAALLDSPVPGDAPWFDTRTVKEENAAHMGANTSPDLIEDDIVRVGGVMSK